MYFTIWAQQSRLVSYLLGYVGVYTYFAPIHAARGNSSGSIAKQTSVVQGLAIANVLLVKQSRPFFEVDKAELHSLIDLFFP